MQSLNLSYHPVYENMVTVVCISIGCFLLNTVPTRLPFDCIGARHPSIETFMAGSPIGFKQAGRLVFSFGLQGCQRFMMHAEGVSPNFVSGRKIEVGCAQGGLLQHRASCWDAEPQYHERPNNRLGLDPAENGLLKRKQS